MFCYCVGETLFTVTYAHPGLFGAYFLTPQTPEKGKTGKMSLNYPRIGLLSCPFGLLRVDPVKVMWKSKDHLLTYSSDLIEV